MIDMERKIMEFLNRLTENNTREWFNANKNEYEEARKAFLIGVGQVIEMLTPTNLGYAQIKPADCIFRIYRDVRFSKDKSPYKTHFGAYLSVGGRKSPMSGHYFHVEPGNSFIAGGVYSPDSELLKAIRSEIYFNPKEFVSILEQPDFVKYFGALGGDRLKNPPAGFDKESPVVDYLKHKSFVVMHPVADEKLYEKGFPVNHLHVFEAINPLNAFLNRGILNKADETH